MYRWQCSAVDKFGRDPVGFHAKEYSALLPCNRGLIGVAKPGSRFYKGVEHGLQIEGRAAYHLEHVGSGGLLLTCLVKLTSELGNFPLSSRQVPPSAILRCGAIRLGLRALHLGLSRIRTARGRGDRARLAYPLVRGRSGGLRAILRPMVPSTDYIGFKADKMSEVPLPQISGKTGRRFAGKMSQHADELQPDPTRRPQHRGGRQDLSRGTTGRLPCCRCQR